MNLFILVAFVGVVVSRPLEEWHTWKSAHGKNYAHQSEENARRQIWMENAARIEEHNAENRSFTLGLNQFADMVCDIANHCIFLLIDTDILSLRPRRSFGVTTCRLCK